MRKMVKKRLIACLLCRDGVIVQSKGFSHTNAVGDAFTAVDFFNMWAIDEIIILDVSRNKNQRQKFYDIIYELSQRCFVPLNVGGWITSIEDANTLLQKGADKITINTEAVRRPDFIKELSEVFGSQFVVVSIDVKINDQGEYEVYIDRGKCPIGLSPLDWAKKAEQLGAGEIFLTSIDQDGALKGYDLKLVKKVAEIVEIPVIASGGVGNWQHLVDGVKEGKADAVSAANIFHYTEQSTKNAKEYMKNNGVDVRKIYFYTIDTPRRPKYVV
jgi:cyclase